MNNKGLKIIVAVLAVVFVACIAVAVIFKDDMDYKKAKAAGTKEAYTAFLQKHPDSEFFGAAKRSLDSIEAVEYDNLVTNEFNRIQKDPKLRDLMEFMKSYPDCKYAPTVRKMIGVYEDRMYKDLTAEFNPELAYAYVQVFTDGKYFDEISKMIWVYEEDYVYSSARSQNTVAAFQQYIDTYPQGKYLREAKAKLAEAQEQAAYNLAKSLATANGYRDYLASYPNGKHRSEIRGLLDDIEAFDRYKDNSLANGAQPYSAYYGSNKSCQYYGCSEICVKAPHSSDVLVLIKKDNANGKVVRHGYVKGGQQVCFEVPDGRYQTFFYYGKGWYPKKQMQGGVKGGFLRDEIFSKDNPQYLDGQILTYELILQQNGNFSTKPSSQSEMF